MGTFLLLLFIIFIVIPGVRILYTLLKVRSTYRNAFRSAKEQAKQSQRRREAENRPSGWSRPRTRKKKVVDRNEGEYVEWEEVSETEATTTAESGRRSTRVSSYVSERISDAEWEDMK